MTEKDIVEILVEKGMDRRDAEAAVAENEGKGDQPSKPGENQLLPRLT